MDFSYIIELYNNTLASLSGGDSTVKGFMTLGVMGMLGYLGRAIPQTIWQFIRRNTVSSMTFTRQGTYSMDLQNYAAFMQWFAETKWAKYDRNRRVTFDRDDPAFGPGLGFHWFIWEGRYFWFNVSRLNSSGTDIEKEEFTLYTFGRTTEPFERLVESFRIKRNPDFVRIYSPSDHGWTPSGRLRIANSETLILDPQVEKDLWEPLEWFIHNEEWYRNKGLAYKHTIILEGPPGTGKSSLVKAIARRYKRDLHQINLSEHGRRLGDLLSKLQPGDMVCIEDFDDVKTLHRRAASDPTKRLEIAEAEQKEAAMLMDCDIPLSTFLNILQGVIELDDIIIVLSTNHLEKIDPAVYRPARVDKTIHVPFLKDAEIKRYINMMYDNPTYDTNVVFNDTPASTLAGLFKEHALDAAGFINRLNVLTDDYIAENFALQPEPAKPKKAAVNTPHSPALDVCAAVETVSVS